MRTHLLAVLLLCFAAEASLAQQQVATTQGPPTLVADTSRPVAATRVGLTQNFAIVSAILKETRRVQIILPASYQKTNASRRYPVTVVVDGEYLKITPQGLTYGFMNGMRPRAMNLFEGTLTGDTLSGKKRFGGIKFDESGPPLQFSFKRRAT